LDKISLLKSIKPFSEQKKPTIRTTTTKTSINHKDIDLEDYDDDFSGESSRSSHDPYEDFSWGGLHGEEAYIGYWNTD
jgi:hypothetical protein